MGWVICFLFAAAVGSGRLAEGAAWADEASYEAVEEALRGADEALRGELVVDAPYRALRDRGVESFRVQVVAELAKASGVAEQRVQILGVRAPYADVPEASLLTLRARSGAGGGAGSAAWLRAHAGAGVKVDFVVLAAGAPGERSAKDAMKSIRLQLADANSALHAGTLGWLLANARLVCCNAAPIDDVHEEGGFHHTRHRLGPGGVDHLDRVVRGKLRGVPGLLVVEEYLGFPLIVALFLFVPVALVVTGLLWFHWCGGPLAVMGYGRPLRHLNGGLFSCQKDMRVCACAFFCPHIRWASTVSQRRLVHFSVALCLFVLLAWLSSVTILPVVLLAVVGTFYRRRLREQDGIPQEHLAYDFLIWLCCPCCAIAQEARHVEGAGTLVGPPKTRQMM